MYDYDSDMFWLDPSNKLYISMFEGHLDAVSSLWVTEINGTEVLFTGSYDALIRMYSTATKMCIRTIEGHAGMVSSLCTHRVEAAQAMRATSRAVLASENCVWNERLEFETAGHEMLISISM
eukprot:759574-Hanusia_phi.AAC.13